MIYYPLMSKLPGVPLSKLIYAIMNEAMYQSEWYYQSMAYITKLMWGLYLSMQYGS